jgi:hypothetical protein
MSNRTLPTEIRRDLIEKIQSHKRKFRFLNNKAEFKETDRKRRKQILEKKKSTLSAVSSCIGDVFSIAIPILADYIECGKKRSKKKCAQ